MAEPEMMGAFLPLELPLRDTFPYAESPCCAFVNSGRAALEQILRARALPRRMLLPRFSCGTLLEPLRRLGIAPLFYGLDEQLLPQLPQQLEEGDAVLLINYFGFGGERLAALAQELGERCVIDASTALFAEAPPQLPVFYSPRKFAGLPDGGVAKAPFALPLPSREDESAGRALFLLQALESGAEAALTASEAAEAALSEEPRRMSRLTRRLLRSLDFAEIRQRRLENYRFLQAELGELNHWELPEEAPSAPFCYPFVCGIPGLRDELIDAGVALPLFWPEVLAASDADDSANRLARRLLPLPLDQRYGPAEMQRLVHLIRGA